MLGIEKTLDKYFKHKQRALDKAQKKLMETEAQRLEMQKVCVNPEGCLRKTGSNVNLRLELKRLKKVDDQSQVVEPLNQRELQNRMLNELDHDTTYQNILKEEQNKKSANSLKMINADLKMAIGKQLRDEMHSISRIQNENERKNSISMASNQLREKVSEIYSMDFSRRPSCQVLFDPDADISKSFLDLAPSLFGETHFAEKKAIRQKERVTGPLMKTSKNNATTATSTSNSSCHGGVPNLDKHQHKEAKQEGTLTAEKGISHQVSTSAAPPSTALKESPIYAQTQPISVGVKLKENNTQDLTNLKARKKPESQKKGARNRSQEATKTQSKPKPKSSLDFEENFKRKSKKQKSAEPRCTEGNKSESQGGFDKKAPMDVLFSHLVEDDQSTKQNSSEKKKSKKKESTFQFQFLRQNLIEQKRSSSNNGSSITSSNSKGNTLLFTNTQKMASVAQISLKNSKNDLSSPSRVSLLPPKHSLPKNSSSGNLTSSVRYSSGANTSCKNQENHLKVHHLTQAFNARTKKGEGLHKRNECKTEGDESKSITGIVSGRIEHQFNGWASKELTGKFLKEDFTPKKSAVSGFSRESSSISSCHDAKQRMGILKTEPISQLDASSPSPLVLGNLSENSNMNSKTTKAKGKKEFDVFKLIPHFKSHELAGSSIETKETPSNCNPRYMGGPIKTKKDKNSFGEQFSGANEASEIISKIKQAKNKGSLVTVPETTSPGFQGSSSLSNGCLKTNPALFVGSSKMRRTESTAVLPETDSQKQRNSSLKKTGTSQEDFLSTLKFSTSPKSMTMKPMGSNDLRSLNSQEMQKAFDKIPLKSSLLLQATSTVPFSAGRGGGSTTKSTSNSKSKKSENQPNNLTQAIQNIKREQGGTPKMSRDYTESLRSSILRAKLNGSEKSTHQKHLTSAIANQIKKNRATQQSEGSRNNQKNSLVVECMKKSSIMLSSFPHRGGTPLSKRGLSPKGTKTGGFHK